MNLGAMKTALRRYAGVDTTDPLVDWINAAVVEFSEAYPWPFLEATVVMPTIAALETLGLPGDVLKIIKMRLTTEPQEVSYMPVTQFEEEITDLTVPGKPQVYTLSATDLATLWPVPDKVYNIRIRYAKFLPDLLIDIDVPSIPSRYHYTLVEGAAVRALQAESEEDRASTARTVFEDSIDRHITALGGRKQAGKYNQVRDVMGYGS